MPWEIGMNCKLNATVVNNNKKRKNFINIYFVY